MFHQPRNHTLEKILESVSRPIWRTQTLIPPVQPLKLCVIIKGGNVTEILSTTTGLEIEIVDFDEMKVSTNEEEKIFQEKLAEYPVNYS